jgi:hypothetical protein
MAAAFTSAKADIVYADIDPDAELSNDSLGIDFDNDGGNELGLSQYSSSFYDFNYASAFAYEAGTQIVAPSYRGFYAAALEDGDLIDASSPFSYYGRLGSAYTDGYSSFGEWPGVENGYMGVAFDIGGEQHFGWVEMSLTDDASTLTVHGYAYCDDAGVGIVAGGQSGDCLSPNRVPEPGSLGLLALGAGALVGLRRRQRKLKKAAVIN